MNIGKSTVPGADQNEEHAYLQISSNLLGSRHCSPQTLADLPCRLPHQTVRHMDGGHGTRQEHLLIYQNSGIARPWHDDTHPFHIDNSFYSLHIWMITEHDSKGILTHLEADDFFGVVDCFVGTLIDEDLKNLCGDRVIPSGGNRQELFERLSHYN